MKKSLVALAALAVVGAASAQVTGGVAPAGSSVTLFGIIDAAVQHVSNSGGASGTRLTDSGNASSRLGFRGAEDLGGGMYASFWLEAGLNNDDGSNKATNTNNQTTGATGGGGLTFGRRSTLSLGGGFGEVRLGRDYVPQFWNLTHFDPFGTNGVGTTQTNLGLQARGVITRVTASNSISYFTPGGLGGFFAHAQYYMGENASSTGAIRDDGRGAGLRVGYVSGPFAVAASTGRTEYSTGDVRQTNLAGSWNFGVATLMGQLTRDRVGAADSDGFLVGAVMPVGAGEIKASFSRYSVEAAGPDPRASKLAVGYVHNLSKRTALYTTYARVRNNGTSAASVLGGALGTAGTYAGQPGAGSSSSGYDLGVRHSF